jgi:prophage DNA circulation protein
MSLDNLQRAKYKSPNGITTEFDYEDIESSVDKKTAVFENAIGDGTYVQSNGHTSGRFPMRCFFSGYSYVTSAETFLAAILEDGEGVLTHPVHGDITVVPVGTITRVDPLKTGAGQIVFDVGFFETTGLQIGETGGFAQAFDALSIASAMDFTNGLQLPDAVSKAGFRSKLKSMMGKVSSAMAKASGAVGKIQEGIEDTGDSINRGVDTLLGEPLALARQCQILIGEPRRQAELARNKIKGYTNLANDIFRGTLAEPSKYAHDLINTFHLNKMLAKSLIGNTAMMMTQSTEYLTKADYIDAAESLMNLKEDYVTWRDANYDNLELDTISAPNMDTGGGESELTQLVASVASDLFSKALQAKTEVREPLTSDRTPLDLCFEFYGTTAFDVLDMFVKTNQLGGDELILIPKGREVVWYV